MAEMTWVIADHTATPGSSELSVSKGQQVEIVDMNCSGAPDFCLVRLSINASDSQEGLVPVTVLKPLPSSHSKLNNKQRDTDTLGEVPQENDCILPNQHTSPVNKRKGFSGLTCLPFCHHALRPVCDVRRTPPSTSLGSCSPVPNVGCLLFLRYQLSAHWTGCQDLPNPKEEFDIGSLVYDGWPSVGLFGELRAHVSCSVIGAAGLCSAEEWRPSTLLG
uniref:SH3 domain-containing protein n=1 Tax=Anopheles culicifacies TaxID=139723 RepID=A0A182MQD5_9DIPT